MDMNEYMTVRTAKGWAMCVYVNPSLEIPTVFLKEYENDVIFLIPSTGTAIEACPIKVKGSSGNGYKAMVKLAMRESKRRKIAFIEKERDDMDMNECEKCGEQRDGHGYKNAHYFTFKSVPIADRRGVTTTEYKQQFKSDAKWLRSTREEA